MYLVLIFLSILSSCLAGLFGRYFGSWGSSIITTNLLFVSFIFSLCAFYEVALAKCFVYIKLNTWLSSEILHVDWGFMFDTLTVCMCVVVTFVSFLVHLYSTEYMFYDPHLSRFMCYLSLFTFFMLILVTSDNFVQLFLGWEGVGLCSYLLINFWFTRIQANKAAIKAMLLNWIGDFSLLLGIFLIVIYFKSIDFATVISLVPFLKTTLINILNFDVYVLDAIALLLFIGAVGKSAQLFLHSVNKSFIVVKILIQCIVNCSKTSHYIKSFQSKCLFYFTIAHMRNKDKLFPIISQGLVGCVCVRKAVFKLLISISESNRDNILLVMNL